MTDNLQQRRARRSTAAPVLLAFLGVLFAQVSAAQEPALALSKQGEDLVVDFSVDALPPGPSAFHLYRGDLDALELFEQRGNPDGRCDVSAVESRVILSDELGTNGAWYYLASSVLPAGEGSLGLTSLDDERPNRFPCAPVVADCGSNGAGGPEGSTLNLAMDVLGTTREYHRHVPAGLDPATPVPLLIFLHGRGSNHDEAISAYYSIPELADDRGFIAVFPNSLLMEDCPNAEGGKHWDVCENPPDPATSQDIVFVRQLIAATSAQYNICSDRIYTHGHSYGGLFSFYAAMTLPDEIAAFAEHSGGMFGAAPFCWPRCIPSGIRPVPGFLIHSTDDTVVEYAASERLEAALADNGHESSFITLTGWDHTFSNATNQEVWDWLMARPLP